MLVGAGRWTSLIGRGDGSQNVRLVIGELRMAVGADDVVPAFRRQLDTAAVGVDDLGGDCHAGWRRSSRSNRRRAKNPAFAS